MSCYEWRLWQKARTWGKSQEMVHEWIEVRSGKGIWFHQIEHDERCKGDCLLG